MEMRSGTTINNLRGLYPCIRPTTPITSAPPTYTSAVSPAGMTVSQARMNSPYNNRPPPVTTPATVVPGTSASAPPQQDTPRIPDRPAAGAGNLFLRRPQLFNNHDDVHVSPQSGPGVPNIIKLPSYNQAASTMQWWMLFAQWMAFYKMSDEAAIHAFPFHLDEIPRQWFFALEDSIKTNLSWLKNAFFKTIFGAKIKL